MTENRNHPDWNELAKLVDSGPDEVDPATLKHIAACPECRAAWAEAARYRGARILDGDRYSLPRELADRARALHPAARAAAKKRSFLRPAPAFTMGGAALAAVLALFVLFPNLHGGGSDLRPDDPRAAIGSVLALQSAQGMVFPGMAAPGNSGQPVYRSGNGADAALQDALSRLQQVRQDGADDPDETWWLAAGYLAAGRLGLASDLVHQALRRHPDDARLLHLEAITAWQLSEFDRAEQALHRILAVAPADSVALFNLALVQLDTGRPEEAEPVLRSLAAGSRNELLQRRAREALADR